MMLLYGFPDKMLLTPIIKKKAINIIKTSADNGYIEACYTIGAIYYYGYEIPVDEEKALKYLKIAADSGYREALCLYICVLSSDKKSEEKQREANVLTLSSFEYTHWLYKLKYRKDCFTISNDKIIPKGMTVEEIQSKSNFYIPTNELNKLNNDESISLKISADNGNLYDMYKYGKILSNGEGVVSNKKEAVRYFKMAADRNDGPSMFQYGMKLLKGEGIKEDENEAIKYIKMAADHDSFKAMTFYGKMLLEGDKVEINKPEAIKYIKKAVDYEDPESLFIYANILLNGDGVNVNIEEGVQYLKMAADLDYNEAILQYGLMLSKGDKIPYNKVEAVEYLQKSVNKTGDETAMFQLALMLKNEDEIPTDKSKAMYYLKVLSEQGDEEAMFEYAIILYNDEETIDYTFCLSYFKTSADLGNLKSMLSYALIKLIMYKDRKDLLKHEMLHNFDESVDKKELDSFIDDFYNDYDKSIENDKNIAVDYLDKVFNQCSQCNNFDLGNFKQEATFMTMEQLKFHLIQFPIQDILKIRLIIKILIFIIVKMTVIHMYFLISKIDLFKYQVILFNQLLQILFI